MVFTQAYIEAGKVTGTPLTHDDVTGDSFLSAIYFNA